MAFLTFCGEGNQAGTVDKASHGDGLVQDLHLFPLSIGRKYNTNFPCMQ